MAITTIHRSETKRIEILDKDGMVDESLFPGLDSERLVALYRSMVQMRKFDEKALNLQRQGRIGTYGSLRGQEAAQAGLVLHLNRQDWLIPSFREHGVLMGHGIPMHIIYSYWKGDERGNIIPPDINCLPVSVPVGSQLLHATGIGLALKLQNSDAIAIGFAGDGASSEGDFHEALNFAGVFGSRTLFYIQNNQWAISVPFRKQTAGASIAQRADAYGFPGVQVDGNDVLAVYVAAQQAMEHIRAGKGPYLIEALTFRMGDHTTADDNTKYRPRELVDYWKERDPIDRMRRFLVARGDWNETKETDLTAEISGQIEAEVIKLESMPVQEPSSIFNYMYETIPWNLQEQRAAFEKETAR